MPYEHDELPAIVVLVRRAPRRHSGQSDTVVNGVVQLLISQVLGLWQSHIRSLRIEILADLRLSGAVIAVASGAMIGEVSTCLGENFGSRGEGIRRIAFRRRNKKPSRSLGHISFHHRRIFPRAEAAADRGK